jgi:hypothetical protein
MEITTIACPISMSDKNIDPKTSPVWTDGNADYFVASGIIEGYTPSSPITATSNRINVVVGMAGLEALAAMGLVEKLI